MSHDKRTALNGTIYCSDGCGDWPCEIDRLRAELRAEKKYSAEQFRMRYAVEGRLAAVIALCDSEPYAGSHHLDGLVDIAEVRAAATGETK